MEKLKIKKLFKIFIIILFILSFNFALENKSYAKEDILIASSVTNQVKSSFKSKNNDQELDKIAKQILGYIQVVGVGIFLGSIIVYGIKLVTADASQKAEIKQKALLWIAAGIFVFSASKIVQIISEISKGLF